MILLWLILLAVICVYGIRLRKPTEDCMDIPQTTAIKGILVFLILLSHVRGYISLDGKPGEIYDLILSYIGQLMVAPFFFYSGYGVIESFSRKEGYSRHFLKNRFLKTLVHFCCMIPLFAVMNMLLGIGYPIEDYLLCWTGWTSIGNSNWFVFDTFVLYLATWFSFKAFGKAQDKERQKLYVSGLTLFMALCICVILQRSGKGDYWYNTVLCYPFGMLYSCFRKRIELILEKRWRRAVLSILSLVLFFLLYRIEGSIAYSLCACCFCMVVTLITGYLRIVNPIILWSGKYAFFIYILQRIPMIVLNSIGLRNTMALISASLAITILLSILYEKVLRTLDRRLFK